MEWYWLVWIHRAYNIYDWYQSTSAIAIVEYIGNYPGRGFHGNVKDLKMNAPFARTKPKVKDELKSELKHRSVKDVDRQLNRETPDEFEKHKND